MSNRTHIITILDASGSMSGIREEVLNSFNEYIAEQKTDTENEEPFISVVTFNSRVSEPFVKVRLNDFKSLTTQEYSVGGMTACFDAIGDTITKFDEEENVILLIQTDGKENASQRYNRDTVKDLITDKTISGWDVRFLGANIDAKTESENIGIDRANAFQYKHTMAGVKDAYASMSASTTAYRKDVTVKKGL